jgi:hypothetical protein
MNSDDKTHDTTVTFSEHLALAGLEKQSNQGDALALIEAMAICARYKEPFPDWVLASLGNAATKFFDILCPEGPDTPSKTIEPGDINWRFERGRDHFIASMGLSTYRDNAAKIRKRLLRDAYLAEMVALECEKQAVQRCQQGNK